MDFDANSITSIYSQYLSDAAKTASSTGEKLKTGKDYTGASDDELMDACKEFEAYFLEQCFKEMLKTVEEDEESSSTSALVDYYKDSMVQKLAADSTETNSLGLAQMLYEQMKRNYNI